LRANYAAELPLKRRPTPVDVFVRSMRHRLQTARIQRDSDTRHALVLDCSPADDQNRLLAIEKQVAGLKPFSCFVVHAETRVAPTTFLSRTHTPPYAGKVPTCRCVAQGDSDERFVAAKRGTLRHADRSWLSGLIETPDDVLLRAVDILSEDRERDGTGNGLPHSRSNGS
jgi:hypothetical protein